MAWDVIIHRCGFHHYSNCHCNVHFGRDLVLSDHHRHQDHPHCSQQISCQARMVVDNPHPSLMIMVNDANLYITLICVQQWFAIFGNACWLVHNTSIGVVICSYYQQ